MEGMLASGSLLTLEQLWIEARSSLATPSPNSRQPKPSARP